ncbi:MAG: PDZ domain-containing protein [Pirellulaceae bacterium]
MIIKRVPLVAMIAITMVAVLPRFASAQGALERLGNLLRQAEDAVEDARVPADPQPNRSPAFLGALLDNVDPDVPGLIVMKINPGGPAQRAGLRMADVIVAANGTEVTNLEAFGQYFQGLSAGDSLDLVVERNGQEVDLTVVLTPAPAAAPAEGEERLPAPPSIPSAEPPAGDPGMRNRDPLGLEGLSPPPADRPVDPPARGKLGVRVVPLTEQVRVQNGLSIGRGALVQDVTPGSVADRGGIPVGAVIVAFNGRRVDDPAALVNLVQTVPLDRAVPVNYYLGNRIQNTELFFGQVAQRPRPELPPQLPPTLPPQADPPATGRDRPGMRLLEQAIGGIRGGQAQNSANQEEVIQLRNRVVELETELERLREELATLRSEEESED